MSAKTKPYEEKMSSACKHLEKELQAIRAGRANPAVLDKVAVEYYGTPTPVAQLAAVAVPEARVLTISPWDTKLVKEISKAIMSSDIGINPIDDGQMCAAMRWINLRQPKRRAKFPRMSWQIWKTKCRRSPISL